MEGWKDRFEEMEQRGVECIRSRKNQVVTAHIMFPMKNKSRHDLHKRRFYCGQLHFLENDIGIRFRKKL